MSKPRALIVDDEPDIRELLTITLDRMDIVTQQAEDLAGARALLKKGQYDLCLTDMRLPDGNGIDLVELIGNEYSQLPVAVITAHGNMESAIQALKAGAFDFVSKPVDLQMLRRLVNAALKLDRQSEESRAIPDDEAKAILLGRSQAIERIRTMIRKLARSQAPVYISGESGTGKELAARLIHSQGPRGENEFVAVNCGAIPNELMESEFFGHVRGSFTGATTDKRGLFLTAHGGTLFLDEVADLPLHMQVKLLRAIQEKSIRPIGSEKEIDVDIRIISATHKDLAGLVESSEFRQDLFYRLNVIELPIPPLRERKVDIPLLIDHFLKRLAEQMGINGPRIERSALEKLIDYPFPGNIRELENALERAVTLCEAERITLDDLSLHNSKQSQPDVVVTGLPLEEHLEQIEKKLITQALEETRWNRTAAAEKLGISFRALRYRLKKLGLDEKESP